MTEKELEIIANKIETLIYKSHNSLARVQSNQYSELLIAVSELKEMILGITRRQDITNGRIATNEIAIADIKLYHAKEEGKEEGSSKYTKPLIGIISALIITAVGIAIFK